jgi:chorismate synthase
MSRLRFLTAGESHGPSLSAILEGVPAGLALAASEIDADLARRQGRVAGADPYRGASARMRMEQDRAEITSGVLAGETTGAPIAIRIENADHANWKGRAIEPMTVPRPGHADLTGAIKYGYDDLRFSLERASARETAARVAVGAVCRKLLGVFGIRVGSHVVRVGTVAADVDRLSPAERIEAAERSPFRCADPVAEAAMAAFIDAVMRDGDTAGGVFEVIALGVPAGLGSYAHWDRRLSTQLAAALVGIPAITGVEIGHGFDDATRTGTAVHHGFAPGDAGDVVRRGPEPAGLEGGITTGAPLVIRAAMKPLATIISPRDSVDLATGRAAKTEYQRSDYCAVPRAAVVGEAMTAIVLADALVEKLGGDSLAEMLPRASALRQARFDDLHMRSGARVLWP